MVFSKWLGVAIFFLVVILALDSVHPVMFLFLATLPYISSTTNMLWYVVTEPFVDTFYAYWMSSNNIDGAHLHWFVLMKQCVRCKLL